MDISDLLKNFSKNIGVIGRVKAKSALESFNWIIAIYLTFLVPALFIFKNELIIVGFMLAFLFFLLLFYVIFYGFLMIKKPDYLRTEEFQLHKYEMEMMGQKNKEIPAVIIESEPVLENQNLPKLKKAKSHK